MAKNTKAEAALDTKAPFWTTLPGIFTGFGGVIVAITGLVTALYSTGAIGGGTKPAPAPASNTIVSLISTPAPPPVPTIDPEYVQFQTLSGEWIVDEQQPLDVGGAKFTWKYTAMVTDNKLTLKSGTLLKINDNANLPETENGRSAETDEMMISARKAGGKRTATGELTQMLPGGGSNGTTLTIVFTGDNFKRFTGDFIINGHKCILTGTKQ